VLKSDKKMMKEKEEEEEERVKTPPPAKADPNQEEENPNQGCIHYLVRLFVILFVTPCQVLWVSQLRSHLYNTEHLLALL